MSASCQKDDAQVWSKVKLCEGSMFNGDVERYVERDMFT